MAITIDDFSKIWASTSPLTPYAFSDDNYKQGWNFVGPTPPSRQMWDFLQKQNDEKLKYLLDNFNDYLPLAGGTMTGAINGNPVTLTADDGNGNIKSFVANADGTLTWDANNVITSNMITVEEKSISDVTLSANGTTNQDINVSKTGYTAIGIVGYRIEGNYGSSGTVSRCYLSSTTNANMVVHNWTNNSQTWTLYVEVLYIKN